MTTRPKAPAKPKPSPTPADFRKAIDRVRRAKEAITHYDRVISPRLERLEASGKIDRFTHNRKSTFLCDLVIFRESRAHRRLNRLVRGVAISSPPCPVAIADGHLIVDMTSYIAGDLDALTLIVPLDQIPNLDAKGGPR